MHVWKLKFCLYHKDRFRNTATAKDRDDMMNSARTVNTHLSHHSSLTLPFSVSQWLCWYSNRRRAEHCLLFPCPFGQYRTVGALWLHMWIYINSIKGIYLMKMAYVHSGIYVTFLICQEPHFSSIYNWDHPRGLEGKPSFQCTLYAHELICDVSRSRGLVSTLYAFLLEFI